MSVATGNKGEKAKKFQSLNINNLYQVSRTYLCRKIHTDLDRILRLLFYYLPQGSALKPLQKSIPTKHGLQSLGKVPTARRAPANLPSLKAEHSGNDPTINLVPAGHSSSGGWTANKEGEGETQNNTGGKPVNSTNDTVALVKNSSSSSVSAVSVSSAVTSSVAASTVSAAAAAASATSVASTAAAGGSPPPSSLSSKTTWGQAASKKTKPYISQRSPLFGQEFPSLTGNTESPAQPIDAETGSPSPPPGNKADSKYGPGPCLRPQSFATWSFSGGKQTQQQQQPASTNNTGLGGQDKDAVDKSGSVNPSMAAYEARNRNLAEAGGLKFDVGVNSPLLQQGAPFIGRKHSAASQRGQLVNKNSSASSAARPRENLFQGTIIDSEKLKRMDDIDSNDDDWTRRDEAFDYNKKIDR